MDRLRCNYCVPRNCGLAILVLLLTGCGGDKTGVSSTPPQVDKPAVTAPATDPKSQSPSAAPDEPDGTNVPAKTTAAEQAKPAAATPATTDVQPNAEPASDPKTTDPATATVPPQPAGPPPEVAGLTRLDPKYEVWIDPRQKRVLMTGEIVRQEGQLEMFACLKNTKEHESVVAVNAKAYIVNAALIALGANPGGPVEFRPEFKPASGPEVEVTVLYTDKQGKRREVRGQEWIRNIKTGKELQQPWVFAGSGFWEDESTGQRHFMAEDGDFICISNFTSAMLDLPVESSQASAELMFEAFTERIPPVKTPVVLVLKPKLEPAKDADSEQAKRADRGEKETPAAAKAGDSSTP